MSHHLALIHRHSSKLDERILGVVHGGEAITVAIVSLLVVIPYRDPGKGLVAEQKIKIGSVLCNAGTVVVESEKSTVGVGSSGIHAKESCA